MTAGAGRLCTQCGLDKPAEEFTQAHGRDALHSWCRVCLRAYERQRRVNGATVHEWVPAGPVRDHVAALAAATGWTPTELAAQAGVERACVRHLLGLFKGRPEARRTRADVAEALLAVPVPARAEESA